MRLLLKRQIFSPKSTIGTLYVDDAFESFTLEDCVRPVKIPGETAIPAGTYDVDITFSNRFGRRMPLLMNVPGFSGVRIHSGNTSAQTEGCILVGQTKAQDQILHSKVAYDALFLKLDAAKQANDPITISIVEERDVPQV